MNKKQIIVRSILICVLLVVGGLVYFKCTIEQENIFIKEIKIFSQN